MIGFDALEAIRAELREGRRQQARSIAHSLLDNPSTRTIGYIGSAIVALAEGFPSLAQALVGKALPSLSISNTAHEPHEPSLQVALSSPALKTLVGTARAPLDALAVAMDALHATSRDEVDARFVFLHPTHTHQTINSINSTEANRSELGSGANSTLLRTSLALLDYVQPIGSDGLDDTTIATAIAHTAQELRRLTGQSRVGVVLKDIGDAPAPQWLLVSGMTANARCFEALAQHEISQRTFFLSLRVRDASALTPRVVAWLRSRQPIGCHDLSTLLLLKQAQIRTFLAGSPSLFLKDVISTLPPLHTEPNDAHISDVHRYPTKIARPPHAYSADEDKVPSSLAHYLRAVHFDPSVRVGGTTSVSLTFEGVLGLSNDDAHKLRTRYQERLDGLLTAILRCATLGGRPECVDAEWQSMCRTDVEATKHVTRLSSDLSPTHSDVGLLQTLAAQRLSYGDAGSKGRGIEIAFAVDTSAWEHLPVVLQSLIDNVSLPVRVHLFTRGLKQSAVLNLAQDFASASFTFCNLDDFSFGNNIQLLRHTTLSTLDRLLIPELLRDVDRVIYLDTDLVVLGDLAELWKLDLHGKRLAAKSSTSKTQYVHQMVHNALSRLPFQQASEARRYIYGNFHVLCRAFNAGVLVMNLARMREENFTRRFLPMIEHFCMNDQDVLNVYAGSERVELPPEWNVIPRQDLTDGAKLIHFAGPVKPWSDLYIHRACDFLAYEAKYRTRTGRDLRQVKSRL